MSESRTTFPELDANGQWLKPYLEEALPRAYLKGVELAVGETNLPHHIFPAACPYRLAEILDSDFYPGKPSELV